MFYKILIFLLVSCSFNSQRDQPKKGHSKLYSHPEKLTISKLEKNERRIILVATNDQQGQLEVQQEIIKDKTSPGEMIIPVGGIDVFEWHLNVLRDKFPEQVLLVDSGQWLTGSLIAEKSNYEAIFSSLEKLRYDALGLGENDFLAFKGSESNQLELKNIMKDILNKSRTPVVVSNLVDLSTNSIINWGKTTSSLIKVINQSKIGIIGAISPQIVMELDPLMTNGLYFEKIFPSLLLEARKLKNQKVDAIVILLNSPVFCGTKRSEELKIPLNKVNFNPLDPNVCEQNGEVYELIEKFPPELIDVVVAGGAALKVSNRIKSVDVLQSFGHGKYFSWMELIIDNQAHQVVKNKTKIYQPIKLCHQFFKETEDCYSEDNSVDHRELIPMKFLGITYQPILKASNDLSPFQNLVSNYLASSVSLENFHQLNLQNHHSLIIPKGWWKKQKTNNPKTLSEIEKFDGLFDPLVKITVDHNKRNELQKLIKSENLNMMNRSKGMHFLIPFSIWKNNIIKLQNYLGISSVEMIKYSVADHLTLQTQALDFVKYGQSQKTVIGR
jgi:hypothetical protein